MSNQPRDLPFLPCLVRAYLVPAILLAVIVASLNTRLDAWKTIPVLTVYRFFNTLPTFDDFHDALQNRWNFLMIGLGIFSVLYLVTKYSGFRASMPVLTLIVGSLTNFISLLTEGMRSARFDVAALALPVLLQTTVWFAIYWLARLSVLRDGKK